MANSILHAVGVPNYLGRRVEIGAAQANDVVPDLKLNDNNLWQAFGKFMVDGHISYVTVLNKAFKLFEMATASPEWKLFFHSFRDDFVKYICVSSLYGWCKPANDVIEMETSATIVNVKEKRGPLESTANKICDLVMALGYFIAYISVPLSIINPFFIPLKAAFDVAEVFCIISCFFSVSQECGKLKAAWRLQGTFNQDRTVVDILENPLYNQFCSANNNPFTLNAPRVAYQKYCDQESTRAWLSIVKGLFRGIGGLIVIGSFVVAPFFTPGVVLAANIGYVAGTAFFTLTTFFYSNWGMTYIPTGKFVAIVN